MAKPIDIHQYVVSDPQIMRGELIFRGTRVPLRTILSSLAAGDNVQQILKSFPSLSHEQVQAAIAFAAASAREDLPPPRLPAVA